MVEVNPPNFLGAECYTFENFRQSFAGVVCAEGVTEAGDLAVSAVGGASVNVNVAAGSAWVEGDLNGAEGMYYVENDASVTVTIAANGAGTSRIDRIIATVYDSQYIGSADSWAIEVVQGTAGAGVPAVPDSTRSGWLDLAHVTVPASGGTPSVVSSWQNVMKTCGTSNGAPPYVELESTGPTNCTNNVRTKLDLANEVHRDEGYFTVAASVVTVLEDGLYHMQANAGFEGKPAGSFEAMIGKNGLVTGVDAYFFGGSTLGYWGASPTALFVPLVAGNTIQVGVKQVTGSTQTCDYGGLKIWKVG